MKADLKLLWIDDDANGLLSPLGRFLMRSGFIVRKVEDVRSAEQQLANDTFDAVLLDLMLPIDRGEHALSSGLYIAKGIRAGKYWDKSRNTGTKPKTTIALLSYLGSDPEILSESEGLRITSFAKAVLLEPRKIEELVRFLARRKS